MSDKIKTVGELLNAAKENPELLYRAHRKVWKAISAPLNSKEPEVLSELTDAREKRMFHDQPSRRMRYPLFADFFGIDPKIAMAAEYFKDAAAGGTNEQQLLELVSNTGCGKTTWLRTIAQQMYNERFFYLTGCPYKEHPLHSVPFTEREDLFLRWYYFRGELCRKCEEKLQKEFHGEWKNFPVEDICYRLGAGIGILQEEGALPEPEKNGKIPDDWHQIFKLANGGILFIDLPAQPKELRSMLARFVSDGTLKAEDRTDWWPDFALVSVSNKKLADEFPLEKPLLDRIVTVTFPMVTNSEAELRIQIKQTEYEKREFHFMPRVEKAFAHLVTASRIEQVPNYNSTIKIKNSEDALVFHNGGAILADDKTLKVHSYQELMRLRPKDGIQGITRRNADHLLASAGQWHKCVGIQHLLLTLREEAGIENGVFSSDIRARVKDWLGSLESDSSEKYNVGLMEKKYQEWVLRDLVRGWIGDSFKKKMDEYFNKYLDHASAYVRKVKPRDDAGKEMDLDSEFLDSVEKHINNLNGNEKDNFRTGVISAFKKPPCFLADHPPLKEAITNKIVAEYRAEIRLAIIGKAPDPGKAKLQLEKMKTELGRAGYKPCCLENLEGYARRSILSN